MTLKSALLHAQDILLNLVRCWWRPVTCIGLAVSVWVNLVIIPLYKWQVPDLSQAGIFVTAITAALAVRAFEKWKDVA